MLDLNQLKQIICIEKNKTISDASKELHMSQSALSRSMQRLETQLGVELFDHQKNKITINQNGLLIVDYAKKIIDLVNQMSDEVVVQDQLNNSINVACSTPAPLWDIEPLLNNLYCNTQIKTTIDNDDHLLDNLLKNRYHIIITPFEITNEKIICIPYLEENLCLSIPPTHRYHNKNEVSFKDMDDETMLVYSHIGFWNNIHLKNMSNTKFISQDNREDFLKIINSSTLPSFTTNLSIKREGPNPNRIIIPFNDDIAHITFFVSILKKNKNKYINLLDLIKEYYDY